MVTYQLLFGALGLLCGIGVAAGVFALVASLGMVPRMAGKTSVAAYVPALENGLIAGGIFGCVLAVFPDLPFPVGTWFLGVYGLASGVFSGCLSVALAEVLNVFPVLFRRMGIKTGLEILSLHLERLQADWFIFSVLPDKRSAKVHQVTRAFDLSEKV